MQKIYYNNISFLKIIFTLQILYGHIIQYFIMYQKEFNKFQLSRTAPNCIKMQFFCFFYTNTERYLAAGTQSVGKRSGVLHGVYFVKGKALQ